MTKAIKVFNVRYCSMYAVKYTTVANIQRKDKSVNHLGILVVRSYRLALRLEPKNNENTNIIILLSLSEVEVEVKTEMNESFL